MTDTSVGSPRRRAGLLLPLFSMASTRSWGIGDISDMGALAPWLRMAGLRAVQVLPVNDMATGQSSPYSALTAMATDPIYIAVDEVPDVQAGLVRLESDERGRLDAARQAPRVDYSLVRPLKMAVLRRAFETFAEREWRPQSARAAALRAFVEEQSWWLDEYALFRVLHDRHEAQAWWDWPEPLARRDEAAIAQVRSSEAHELLFIQWLQWTAHEQWTAARRALEGINLIGDLPFMVSSDSADVWARPHLFSREATVGTPPDAFSETGQNWGLPVYRWDMMALDQFTWLRLRGRRAAAMFDAYRVDHLVGFYRTYNRPVDGSEPFFSPADEHDQRRLGEAVLEVFRSAGASIIAEDLGTIPDFVRESMAHLGIPGYRVLRWEREWKAPGQPFRDPAGYPATSLATTGTHDTDMLVSWWETADQDEREALLALPELVTRGFTPDQPLTGPFLDALIELLMQAGSDLAILPLQDIFGWPDVINVPGSVGEENWSWRSRIPVDQLVDHPEASRRAEVLHRFAAESGRT